jgi:hypothetical protein
MSGFNTEVLLNLISEQKKVIDELQTKVTNTEEQCDRVTRVVHQLLGGLFNQVSQSGTSINHVNMLVGHKSTGDEHNSPDGWGIWPTTRQGDVLERKVNELADTVERLLQHTPTLDEFKELEYKVSRINHRISSLQDQLQCDLCQHMDATAKDFEKLDKNIRDVGNDVVDITYALKEIGAGLFNMETQRGAWKSLRETFIHDEVFDTMPEKSLQSWTKTTSKWNNLPTTRQGDECEERLDKIEAKMQLMMKALSGNSD